MDNTGRVWIIAGDGSAGDILRADVVYAAMDKEWKPAGEWDFLPLVLKLYVRRV